MRYGEPSIQNGLEKLRAAGVDELVVIPLYPQFSHTTTSSIYDAVDAALEDMDWNPPQRRVQDYHVDEEWTCAIAQSIWEYREQNGPAEKLLFSLHGIPERYVRQGDPYRDQCEAGVRAVVDKLGLADDEWLLTFQSRVGREPWLQPYTDETLEELGKSGVKTVQVVCPGFAVTAACQPGSSRLPGTTCAASAGVAAGIWLRSRTRTTRWWRGSRRTSAISNTRRPWCSISATTRVAF